MAHRREEGAILEILVIGIVLVAAVALIAWRYIEADKAQNEAERSLASQSISAPPNNVLSLIKIGARLKVSAAMTQTYGTLTATKVDAGYELRSAKAKRFPWKCDDKVNDGLLGTLSQSTGSDGEYVVGANSYHFTSTSDKVCFNGDEGEMLINEFKSDLKKALLPIS